MRGLTRACRQRALANLRLSSCCAMSYDAPSCSFQPGCPMMSSTRPLSLLLPLLLASTSCASPSGANWDTGADPPERAPEHAWVIFGADSVRAEVARTATARERGLMFRDTLPDGTGMLFVFERPEIQGVWMRDTHVALDAAFIDEASTITSIEPLEPGDTTVKYSESPVLFVLETPRGWLAEHGVTVGDTAVIVFGESGGSGSVTFRPQRSEVPGAVLRTLPTSP